MESTSPVEYEDSDQCRVESGEWNGPYTGEQFTDPIDLDVDHMVPLANAHRSGGWLWSESRRRDYANDLSYEGHLIAVQNSQTGPRAQTVRKAGDRPIAATGASTPLTGSR